MQVFQEGEISLINSEQSPTNADSIYSIEHQQYIPNPRSHTPPKKSKAKHAQSIIPEKPPHHNPRRTILSSVAIVSFDLESSSESERTGGTSLVPCEYFISGCCSGRSLAAFLLIQLATTAGLQRFSSACLSIHLSFWPLSWEG